MTNLDLGVIGNGIVAALIDRCGRIVWHCLPRFDGDPVFCSLLNGDDPEDGFAEVVLENLADAQQAYQGNTAILSTVLTDARGASIRITDFCPRFKQFDRIYRPSMIVRRVEPIAGLPMIRLRFRPLAHYGSQRPQRTYGSNHIRYVSAGHVMRLTTDAPLSYLESESAFALIGPVNIILGPDETLAASIAHSVRDFHERSFDYWIEWSRYLSVPFEWQEAVIRAAITLKLCSFEDTGAIVAALTTSIPEAAGTRRNWDYRACWLRDGYHVVQTLNRLGATRTMEDFLGYITTIAAGAPDNELKPVYGILPGTALDEVEDPTLAGYRGMGPVRIGNLAQRQTQNDSYGSVILAAVQMFFDRRLPKQGDLDLFMRLEKLGAKAVQKAFEPDAGMWEFRTRLDVHTHSVALCWAGCDRLAKIALALGQEERARYWHGEADAIRERLLKDAWNEETKSFVAVPGGRDVDASLLLLQELGLVSPDDPRFIATLKRITKELRHEDGHLFRYATPDDFGMPRTSFIICTFWYIDALAASGRREEARRLFESVLARRNHLGLLSEDLDPVSGELWGNYPQTYSLVGLVLCAMRLSKSWEEAFWRGW